MTKQELSRKFDVSLTTISNWLAEGMPYIRKGGRGQVYDFDVKKVEGWVNKYKLPASTNDMSYAEARRRRESALAAIKELDLQLKQGRLINTEKAQKEWQRVLSIIRNRLLGLPTKLTPVVYGCGSPGEVFTLLKKEIHHVLDELGSRQTYRKEKDDKSRTRKIKKLHRVEDYKKDTSHAKATEEK